VNELNRRLLEEDEDLELAPDVQAELAASSASAMPAPEAPPVEPEPAFEANPEIARLRSQRPLRNLLTNIGRIGDTVGSALSGTKGDDSFYDTLDKQNTGRIADLEKADNDLINNEYKLWAIKRQAQGKAANPLQDELTRARIEAIKGKNEEQARETALLGKLDDPNTPEHQNALRFLQTVPTAKAMLDALPPGTAPKLSMFPGIKDLLKLSTGIFNVQTGQEGQDRRQGKALEHSATQGDLNRAASAAKGETRAGEKQAERYLEGYELVEGAMPKAEEAMKLRAAQANKNTIEKSTKRLLDLYGKYGTQTLPGAVRSEMEALIRDLQLTAKNEDLYKLGVLTGPDLALLESIIPMPTGAKASALDFFGAEAVPVKLRTFLGQVGNRFDSSVRASGYRKRGSAPPAAPAPTAAPTTEPAAAATPASPSVIQIRSKATGKVKPVPASQAKRFLDDPNFEVVE
jgi:hypothetical protein